MTSIPGLGKSIKELREARDMTQQELSDQTFITRGHLSNIENDAVDPSLDALAQIAEALGTDIPSLIAIDDNYDNSRPALVMRGEMDMAWDDEVAILFLDSENVLRVVADTYNQKDLIEITIRPIKTVKSASDSQEKIAV
jgi:transcriptional regulator with XRE-family HTH domain